MRNNRLERYWADFRPALRGICSLQDDGTVGNGPGATVRADINSQIQALQTMNSGTAAPGTTWANQLWADTTNALAKKRNNANGAWVTFADRDFQHWLLDDGTVGAPAYSFNLDPDSGMYRIGANNIGIGVNGAKVLDIGTSGLTVTGSLGVGIAPAQLFHADKTWNGSSWAKVSNGNNGAGAAAGVLFGNDGGDLGALSLLSSGSTPGNGLFLRTLSTNALYLGTNNTPTTSLDSTGQLTNTCSGNGAAAFVQNSHAVTPFGLVLKFTAAAPNNTTDWFLQATDTGGIKGYIYSNGTFGSATNTYGAIISMSEFKSGIVLSGSQWEDVKWLADNMVKFDQQNVVGRQLGWTVDENDVTAGVESRCPGLIFEHEEMAETEVDGKRKYLPTGRVLKGLKTSIVHMKATKALGEALHYIDDSVKPALEDHESRLVRLEERTMQ